MNTNNISTKMKLDIDAIPENESFARVAVSAFFTRLNPTLEEINDVKTAVSEAVTNAIIHGYDNSGGIIHITAKVDKDMAEVEITDDGIGIADVAKAMEPLYSGKPDEERSGMGFSFMEAFMDDLEVISTVGEGTVVRMKKRIGLKEVLED